MNIFGLGLPELIVIALILLLFFGPKRLPGLFRSIGTSIRELKTGLAEDKPQATGMTEATEPTESTTPTSAATDEPTKPTA